MIISVGYRVHSLRGVQFRMWATRTLKEYLIKGFALNDELLARIRDIRSSEKVFYRKVLEIYALSIDYAPRSETTQNFFKTVQNKMHFAVHGHTAAELIYDRADAEYDKFEERTRNELSPVELHFIENFERERQKLLAGSSHPSLPDEQS